MVDVIKVMFDRTVRSDAIVGRRTPFPGLLGGQAQEAGQVQRRPRRNDWRQDEIDLLPQLGQLIRAGKIHAYSTFELENEHFRVLRLPSTMEEDIFAGCDFTLLGQPFDRSKWGLSLDQLMDKQALILFCKNIFLNSTDSKIEDFIRSMRTNPHYNLSPFEEKCLRSRKQFQSMCRGVAETHIPDLWHLWTAEMHGLDAMITHDRKLTNVVARQKVTLKCKAMLSSTFLKEFFKQSSTTQTA